MDEVGGRRLQAADPKTITLKAQSSTRSLTDEYQNSREIIPEKLLNPRKFVSYTSSEWEKIWLENVQEWTDEQRICEVMNTTSSSYMHDFLNATCTTRYEAPHDNWCIIDDEYRPMYYNTGDRSRYDITWVPPPFAVPIDPDFPKPFNPTSDMEHVFSKFVFLDETTGEEYVEYIEPLVSHLRYPLARCLNPEDPYYYFREITFRGWLMPPPNVRNERKFYFDAGASQWDDGAGGPSLKYFEAMWKRHGMEWDDIYAYEMMTTAIEFYQTVPPEFMTLVHYLQCAVSSSPLEHTDETPFLPFEVMLHTMPEDYVLLKLDIDAPTVENGNIDYLFQTQPHNSEEEDQFFNVINEVVYEHHIYDNYLMRDLWGTKASRDSMEDSYRMFLNLRLRGIRAHSWI